MFRSLSCLQGRYKLLHRMQTARGMDGWCDACNATDGCTIDVGTGPGADHAPVVVPLGGQLCCFAMPPSQHNHSASCAPYTGPTPLPSNLLYDILTDPSEEHNLAMSMPDVVADMHARLQKYNSTSVPCCICAGSDRTSEMDHPPDDGYWYSFADQGPNPAKECALQNADLPP